MRSILKSEMYSLEAMDKFFKDQNKENGLSVTPVGRLGGLKVTFIMDNKIMSVTRNELTKWAVQLASKRHKKEARRSVVSWLKSIDQMADARIRGTSSFRRTLRDIRRLGSNIAKREALLVGMCHTKKEYNSIKPKDLQEERYEALEADSQRAKRRKKGRPVRKMMEPEVENPSERSRSSEGDTPPYHVDTLTAEQARRILADKSKLGKPMEGHRKYNDWRPAHRKPRPKAEGTIGPSKSAEDLGTFVKKDTPTGTMVIKEDRETKSEP
jgi:hypothetical protein